jgi:multisubunit Na+/H+ antiporter MnhB subunit
MERFITREARKAAHTCSFRSSSSECTGMLLNASSNGDLDLVVALLHGGVAPSTLDSEGRTALHFAADQNSAAVACELIAHDAPLDVLDHHGRSALRHAVDSWSPATGLVLLAADASVDWASAATLSARAAVLLCSIIMICRGLRRAVASRQSRSRQSRSEQPRGSRQERKDRGSRRARAEKAGSSGPASLAGLAGTPRALLVSLVFVLYSVNLALLGLYSVDAALTAFCLTFAAGTLFFAALYPSLAEGRGWDGQQKSRSLIEQELLIFRCGAVAVTLFVVVAATTGRTMLTAFDRPGVTAGDQLTDPFRMLHRALSGGVTMRLSVWIRLCSALHSAVFELVTLPLIVACLQVCSAPSRLRREP